MSYYGKVFAVESQENYDEFVKSMDLYQIEIRLAIPAIPSNNQTYISLPEEKAKNLLEYKPSQKVEKNGDEYLFTIYTSNGEKVYKAKSGVEFADSFRDLPVKVTFTVDGNKVTQIIKFDIGFTLTIKKEYFDDKLNEELSHSMWDGVARKVYKPL